MTIRYIVEMYFSSIFQNGCVGINIIQKKGEGPLSNFASGPMISLDGPAGFSITKGLV